MIVKILQDLLPVILVIAFVSWGIRVKALERERDHWKKFAEKILKDEFGYKALYEEERKKKLEFRDVISTQSAIIRELKNKKDES